MKKQELIYMHQLLHHVQEDAASRGIPIDTSEYEGIGVSPSGIHRSKGDHEDAVQTLVSAIVDGIEKKETESEASSTDPVHA